LVKKDTTPKEKRVFEKVGLGCGRADTKREGEGGAIAPVGRGGEK